MATFTCRPARYAALVILAFLLLLAHSAAAQGGQGGAGFGGGGAGGFISRSLDDGDSGSFKHILTPGDRGEWPLTVAAGETVIVFVTSETFDPAAQIVDAAGKVLAENDDIRPGVQDSLLLYRFLTAGEYKILVKGFKSVAGGQYTLTLRRFLPSDLRKGERNTAVLGRTHIQWHRFSAEAGETLVVTTRSAVFDPNMGIYAPNGEQVTVEARSLNAGRTMSMVFRAETKGDYYLRVATNREDSGGYAVTVAPARVSTLTLGATSPLRRLNAGGLDLWRFSAIAGDLIHVEATGSGPGVSIALRYLPDTAKAGASTEAQAPEESLTRLPSDPKARGEIVALLKRAGSYQVEVSQPLGMEVDYTFSLSRAGKAWTIPADLTGQLPLGGSDYWKIEGKAGQIIRLEGLATPFDIALELYNPRGERVEANDDGAGGHNALLTALLKESGRYLIRVHSYGDGGSGTYQLRHKPDPLRPIQIGVRSEGSLGAGSSDIWSFQGKAGQTILLSVRSQDFDTHVNVFGPDAIEVANDDNAREGTDSLLSIHLPLNGVYTVWVSARSAGGKYIIRIVDAD